MDYPTITLGSRAYPMPPLAIKQMRKVIPRLLELATRFQPPFDPTKLSEDDMNELSDVIYIAITRGSPQMTREQFDDIEATLPEMIASIDVIGAQAGMTKRREAGQGAHSPLLPSPMPASSPTLPNPNPRLIGTESLST
jgi:hypothetical protein